MRFFTLILAASGSGRDFISIMSLAVTFFPSADDRQENVVQINVLDDIFVEDDETLSSVVSLTAADAVIDLNPAVANITIFNDDSRFYVIMHVSLHNSQLIIVSIHYSFSLFSSLPPSLPPPSSGCYRV